jgi:hypothetical protein
VSEDWLALPSELGGRRFGPLPDAVAIGTDSERAHLILAERTGLPGVAVELIRTRSGWSIDTPPIEGWTLGVRRADARETEPKALRAGSRLEPGDTLVLRGAAEIRLTLLRAPQSGLRSPDDPARLAIIDLRPATPDASNAPGQRASTRAASTRDGGPRDALAAEAARQAGARLIAGNPIAQRLDAAARWIGQGGWRSPAFVVTAVMFALCSITTTVAALAWLAVRQLP